MNVEHWLIYIVKFNKFKNNLKGWIKSPFYYIKINKNRERGVIVISENNKSLKSVGLVRPKIEEDVDNMTYNINLKRMRSNESICKFIQREIDFASEVGYKNVKFPKQQTLNIIDDFNGVRPSDNKKYMPSFLKLHTNTTYNLNGSTIRVQSNNYIGYNIIDMELLENTKLCNGILEGDKELHNYTSDSTHEWGYGVKFAGCKNCAVENVEIKNMTGDGVYFGMLRSFYSPSVPQSSMEVGKINTATGELVEDVNSYRINKMQSLDALLNDSDKQKGLSLNNKLLFYPGNEHGYGPMSQFKRKNIVVVFYDEDQTFLSSKEDWLIKPINIPEGARYFKYYFPNKDMETFTDQGMMIRIGERNEQVFVDNCYIHHCRRQGVSISGSLLSGVKNSIIDNIKGTAPQSCIDIEDGGHTTENILIENNIFKDSIYGVINYDGNDHIIKDNYIENCNLAMTINACGGLLISGNTFVQGKVSFGLTVDYNGYSPRIATLDSCKFYNNSELTIKGNVIASNLTIRDVKNFNLNDGASLSNSLIVEENKKVYGFYVENSTMNDIKILTLSEAERINLRITNSKIKGLYLPNGTLDMIGENYIYDSTILSYSYFGNNVGSYKIYFYNCNFGRRDSTRGIYIVTYSHTDQLDIVFEKCKFIQPAKYIYGLTPIFNNHNITFRGCDITFYGDYLIFNNGTDTKTGTVTIEKCIINSLNANRIYSNRDNLPAMTYLIDNTFTKTEQFPLSELKIIDEDNIWG